jgi:hypothetical protein
MSWNATTVTGAARAVGLDVLFPRRRAHGSLAPRGVGVHQSVDG